MKVVNELNPECICALALAILNDKPLSADQAFAKLKNPSDRFSLFTNIEDILMLKKAGSDWAEINELLGCNNSHSTYCKYVKRKKEKAQEMRNRGKRT